MRKEEMKNIPEKIYLNVAEDTYYPENEDFNEILRHRDVTWSRNRIYQSDVCYQRIQSEPVEQKKIVTDVLKNLSDLRNGIFKDETAVNDLIDRTMEDMEKLKI